MTTSVVDRPLPRGADLPYDSGRYQELSLDERGWLWSEQLQLWLGLADYTFSDHQSARVLQFFTAEGDRLPTDAERAEAAKQAEAAAKRVEAAEVEVARLHRELHWHENRIPIY